jgi:S1-C subfamily serine protease
MKKLFSTILVLSLLLSGNAYAFFSKSFEEAWRDYRNYNKRPHKVFVITLDGKRNRWQASQSLKEALDKTLNHKWCKDGCIVKNINNQEISIERQIEITKKYYSSYTANKIIEVIKPKKNIVQKPKDEPKEKKPKISPDDNKIVPAGSGSGFFVSNEGHIITNHHVIDGCNITKVSFKGNQLEAKVLAVDKMNDIAILKTNIAPVNIFPISNEDVSLLEDVVVAGYPLGKQVSSAIKTHKGVVTALAGAGDNYSNFQTDATINAGNSGGPIMNQKGNIVGIAVQTWVEEGGQGIHFGIKSSTLKTFANSNSLTFIEPNIRELSNKDLGKLITEATVYLECHMTIAKIKKMIAAADNRKAFFSEFK